MIGTLFLRLVMVKRTFVVHFRWVTVEPVHHRHWTDIASSNVRHIPLVLCIVSLSSVLQLLAQALAILPSSIFVCAPSLSTLYFLQPSAGRLRCPILRDFSITVLCLNCHVCHIYRSIRQSLRSIQGFRPLTEFCRSQ